MTVTVTAQPVVTNDPAGPKKNGNYLLNSQLSPGTWQCDKGNDRTFWRIKDQGGDTMDNGFGTIASIDADAYSADLLDCAGTWTLVP